jgi:hypothetical protein
MWMLQSGKVLCSIDFDLALSHWYSVALRLAARKELQKKAVKVDEEIKEIKELRADLRADLRASGLS